MKNGWTNFIIGTVRIRIVGKGIERFVNLCVRQGIMISHVKKVEEGCITATILLKDVKKIRILIRKADCKIYFVRRQGFPFFTKTMWRNSGFVLGVLSFFLLLTLLSNMIWKVEITGASPETEYEMTKKLKEVGVKRGEFQFSLGSPEQIQRYLTDSMNNITWVGVEVKGTSYHFQVVEKNEPKQQEKSSHQHLVAAKKATITKMFVEKGQPLVKVNDVVNEGEVLVSGIIGNEKNKKVVSAKGEVYGETWYRSEVEVPLETNFHVLTGESYNKHYLDLSAFKMPLWAFSKEKYRTTKVEKEVKPLYFFKWKTPLSYEKVIIRENQTTKRVYSKQEAVAKGLETGRKQLKAFLSEDAEIKGEKVLHQQLENGKVKLSIHYQVIENIASTQPIIQGD
ncbi:sporulation protein YqfD [Priestia flexa]|uniref:sporulation protein YqfD n=1 Tax=Priestia flexa TaxID=86664 RepID=UPI00209F50A7|nr:sporulation protein YqfD [Priestia flexa]MCP1190652.1 sporulation protein YqfD [Priestia flexa]